MRQKRVLEISPTLLGCHKKLLMGRMAWRRPLGLEAEFEVGDTARDGKLPYFINSVGEESLGNARDSAKTKAAWRYDVGQSEKHSLQLLHSFAAISGMNLISRLAPQSTNPTAFFFLTSAQYLTHRPQRMQNYDSFSKRSLSAPYS